jgi:hypothetical protein
MLLMLRNATRFESARCRTTEIVTDAGRRRHVTRAKVLRFFDFRVQVRAVGQDRTRQQHAITRLTLIHF